MLMLILAIILAAIAAITMFVAVGARVHLNAHVPMPVAETEAVVLWGPWLTHEARCACSVCR